MEDQKRKWVKPAVPGNVLVDRTSNLMWSRSPGYGRAFWERYLNKSNLTVGSLTGFRVPTLGEWAGFVNGASQPRAAWLAREAGTSSGLGGVQWANDSVHPETFFPSKWTQLTYFDVDDGEKVNYCRFGELIRCVKWFGEPLGTRQLRWLEPRKGQVMLVRGIRSDDYWWPS